MAGVRGWLSSLAGNTLAFGAALLVHLVAAFFFLRSSAAPRPQVPPQLLTDSLELTLAETESETPRPAAALPIPARPPAAAPESAAYLLDTAGAVPLPESVLPPPVALPPPPMPTIPELPESEVLPHETRLPEITLPPAEVQPTETAQPAAGATARLEKPRLLTDLSRLKKRYPAAARRNGWEGTAVVALEIDAHGRLTEARIHRSSGYRVLDEAALAMMRTARFAGGPGRLLQPLEFKLK